MDEASYEAYFGNERTWTTVLSDKSEVPVKKRVKRSKSEKKLGHSDPDSDSSSASASSTGILFCKCAMYSTLDCIYCLIF